MDVVSLTLTDDGRNDPFYKRLALQLNADLNRLNENLKQGSFTQHSHATPEGAPHTFTASGRYLFVTFNREDEDNGMEVWEKVESEPTVRRQAIRWREALPGYDPGPEGDFGVGMMDCTEELLAVAFRNGLVTVWGRKAGETALVLLKTIDHYHEPESFQTVYVRLRDEKLVI